MTDFAPPNRHSTFFTAPATNRSSPSESDRCERRADPSASSHRVLQAPIASLQGTASTICRFGAARSRQRPGYLFLPPGELWALGFSGFGRAQKKCVSSFLLLDFVNCFLLEGKTGGFSRIVYGWLMVCFGRAWGSLGSLRIGLVCLFCFWFVVCFLMFLWCG